MDFSSEFSSFSLLNIFQLLKTVGWRVLVGVGALYGCVYVYERLSWTNSAKERSFKEQYVHHATRKLKLIVDLTSSNCSHQVQQYVSCFAFFIRSDNRKNSFFFHRELSGTFARLCRVVDTATTDMSEELKQLKEELDALETNQKQIKLLRNKANYITSELEIFDTNYLRQN